MSVCGRKQAATNSSIYVGTVESSRYVMFRATSYVFFSAAVDKSIEYALHNSSEFTPQEFAELLRNLPQESCRMAMLFMVLGPILIAYPFFQKYFVKGLTVGAVKG